MSRADSRYRAGFGKARIDANDESLNLFGWAHPDNVGKTVAMPLHARAMVLAHTSGSRLAFVTCDLLAVTEAVRGAVLRRLRESEAGFEDSEVALTATHTHSGPSGYSTYSFYALCAPGFSQQVHDGIVDAIVAAILEAAAKVEPARLYLARAPVPLAAPIAFNRALNAYNKNVDVSPRSAERADEAVDRDMTVLRVDAQSGRPLGLVSWFGLHGTCIHWDHAVIHPDHKGEAARLVEQAVEEHGSPGFVAMFAQGAAGDVTPNHRRDPGRGIDVGRYDDDFASATFVGGVQADHAMRLSELARAEGREVVGGLRTSLEHVDFFGAAVDPRFVHGRRDVRTAAPLLGLGFLRGTPEGPGPLATAPVVHDLAARVRDGFRALARTSAGPRPQGGKVPFWDLEAGRSAKIVGLVPVSSPLARLVSRCFGREFVRAISTVETSDRPFVPRYLPAQLVQIGSLVVALMPSEPTVTSGRRIAAAIREALAATGTASPTIVVNGYANAYAGYVVTPEEYEVQTYEGGSTFYGPWTLPAWCTILADMAARWDSVQANAPSPASDTSIRTRYLASMRKTVPPATSNTLPSSSWPNERIP